MPKLSSLASLVTSGRESVCPDGASKWKIFSCLGYQEKYLIKIGGFLNYFKTLYNPKESSYLAMVKKKKFLKKTKDGRREK